MSVDKIKEQNGKYALSTSIHTKKNLICLTDLVQYLDKDDE